jgi:hypothetical protein
METSTMRRLRLAAESGDAAAQFNLGVLFDPAVKTTTGMPSKATERRRSNGCWQRSERAAGPARQPISSVTHRRHASVRIRLPAASTMILKLFVLDKLF